MIHHMRCEHLENPLAIDNAKPMLSWWCLAPRRGQRSMSAQIQVASRPELLRISRPDLWDSGAKTLSHGDPWLIYAGKPLRSRQQCHWRVRVRDEQGRWSAWSQSAQFGIGLLQKSDWRAKWITHPKLADAKSMKRVNGWHSQFTEQDVPCSITLRWDSPQLIDGIRLFPTMPFDYPEDIPGFLFPVRYRVEGGVGADESAPKLLADGTALDQANPKDKPVTLYWTAQNLQWVRLTITKRPKHPNMPQYACTLAEIQAVSQGKTLAPPSQCSASESYPSGTWDVQYLTDGQTTSAPRIAPAAEVSSVPMIKKQFAVLVQPLRAILRVTARGLYEIYLNGHRVGDQVLAPEWTQYEKRLLVQSYDVTKLLTKGQAELKAQLGSGWWCGRFGWQGQAGFWGASPWLLAQLEIEMPGGQRTTIATDSSWQATLDGPIKAENLYDGETYDARSTSFRWSYVVAKPLDDVRLQPQMNQPMRIQNRSFPKSITPMADGKYLVDFGTDVTGVCAISGTGKAGEPVVLRHAEILEPNGQIYTANLRSAQCTDRYIPADSKPFQFTPRFTYRCFRYVEISGLAAPPTLQQIRRLEFCSDSPVLAEINTPDPTLNWIVAAAIRTQRNNMTSVPTDCPQRDERMGYGGDAMAMSLPTMMALDATAFYEKVSYDWLDGQTPEGTTQWIAPSVGTMTTVPEVCPGWNDALVVIPWHNFLTSGDPRPLADVLPCAEKYIEWISSRNPDGIWSVANGPDIGDWLNGDTITRIPGYPQGEGRIPIDLFGTMMWYRSTRVTAQMAGELGNRSLQAKYEALALKIRQAFAAKWLNPDGGLVTNTQGIISMAIGFGLLDDAQMQALIPRLEGAIARYDGRFSTGFHTTPQMLMALSRFGKHELALTMAMQHRPPSWGYMMDLGHHTIWERWDGYQKDVGPNDPGMNSFSHPAFGAVLEWIIRYVVGIQLQSDSPAYRSVRLMPQPSEALPNASGRIATPRGWISMNWSSSAGKLSVEIEIPCDSRATLILPRAFSRRINEGGKEWKGGVKPISDTQVSISLSSGRYQFGLLK
ncbi:MAG: family 78 glycoside hydrolase catalytic domain [Armatimonadota bacterium]